MDVSLSEEWRQFVENKVASGMYHSASEVIRDGLRLLAEQDEARQQRLKDVQAKVKPGLDQLDRGEGRLGTDVFARLEARIARLERERPSR